MAVYVKKSVADHGVRFTIKGAVLDADTGEIFLPDVELTEVPSEVTLRLEESGFDIHDIEKAMETLYRASFARMLASRIQQWSRQ